MIFCKANYEDPETCLDVADNLALLDKHFRDQTSGHLHRHGNMVVFYSEFYEAHAGHADWLAKITERIVADISGVFREAVEAETRTLTLMYRGAEHTPHADSERPAADGTWEPNHTPNRSHVGLLYLNDDFNGGEITVADQVFLPAAGLLIAFPSTREYVHKVSQVTAGMRANLSVWTKKAGT